MGALFIGSDPYPVPVLRRPHTVYHTLPIPLTPYCWPNTT